MATNLELVLFTDACSSQALLLRAADMPAFSGVKTAVSISSECFTYLIVLELIVEDMP
jgi:hypothetical protein